MSTTNIVQIAIRCIYCTKVLYRKHEPYLMSCMDFACKSCLYGIMKIYLNEVTSNDPEFITCTKCKLSIVPSYIWKWDIFCKDVFSSSELTCEVCENSNPSVFCGNTGIFICEACRMFQFLDVEDNFLLTADHIDFISRNLIFCNVHRKHELPSYHCTACEKLVCQLKSPNSCTSSEIMNFKQSYLYISYLKSRLLKTEHFNKIKLANDEVISKQNRILHGLKLEFRRGLVNQFVINVFLNLESYTKRLGCTIVLKNFIKRTIKAISEIESNIMKNDKNSTESVILCNSEIIESLNKLFHQKKILSCSIDMLESFRIQEPFDIESINCSEYMKQTLTEVLQRLYNQIITLFV